MRYGHKDQGGKGSDWKSAHLPPAARERFEREQREAEAARQRPNDDEECEWLDDDEETFTEDDARTAFLAILKSIELYRTKMHTELALLAAALRDEPALRAAWNKFIDAGGITAHEFERFLDGLPFRHRRTRQRRHLRLVASNSSRRHVLWRSGGDEAA